MKKTLRKFVALLLVAVFMFSLSATAFACGGTHNHSDYPGNKKTKTTPYGTMTGGVHIYIPGPEDVEITACTSIDSKYTMALVTTKMECMDNNTGKSLEGGLENNSPELSLRNTNVCCLSHYHYNENHATISIFTTHEVTYTTSYVLYMSTRTDGDWTTF